MNYEPTTSLTLRKFEGNKIKLAARVAGDATRSIAGASLDAGLDSSDKGWTVEAQAEAYFLEVFNSDKKVIARFIGGQVRPRAGVDLNALEKDGNMLGAEAKWRVTLTEGCVGPIYLHFGAGLSAAVKLEGGSLELKFAGTGFKFGSKMGLSLFDNEITADLRSLYGSFFRTLGKTLKGKKKDEESVTQ